MLPPANTASTANTENTANTASAANSANTVHTDTVLHTACRRCQTTKQVNFPGGGAVGGGGGAQAEQAAIEGHLSSSNAMVHK